MNWRTEFAEETLVGEEIAQDEADDQAEARRKIREIDAAYKIAALLEEDIPYTYDPDTGVVETVYNEDEDLLDPWYDYYGDSIDLEAAYTDPDKKDAQAAEIYQLRADGHLS